MRQCFVINKQTSAEPCDTEGLFDTPSLGQQDETLGELWAAHDLDGDVQAHHRGFEPPGVGAVGDNEDDPGEQRLDLAHQIDAAITILDRSISDEHGQEMAQTVGQDVALAAPRLREGRLLIFLALS
jgi:hypothetical protein